MNELLIIQDSDLELVVSEKTLGSLTTNAIQIRDFVKGAISQFDASNYNDDNIEQAKKDKATLNKAAKALNAKRLEIEKEFTKPFAEFKGLIAESVTLINDASAKIDNIVKANEQQYKDKKYQEIRAFYDSRNENLIPFEKIFKQEWLNKTARMKAVEEAMVAMLSQINDDIKALESYSDDKDVLITFYKDCLNIGNTIMYANRLKEQRAQRQAAEEKLKAVQESTQPTPEPQPVQPSPEPVQSTTPLQEDTEPELLERTFKVKATREMIIALGNFMNANDIIFEKV